MRKNILRISIVVATLFFSLSEAWGNQNTYWGQVTVSLSNGSATGSGKVYVDDKVSSSKKSGQSTGSSVQLSFSLRAESAGGYHFKGWYDNASATGNPISSNSSYNYTVVATSKSEDSPTTKSVWGSFDANNYTVTYEPNGGEGPVMSQSAFKYKSSSNILRRNTYTKSSTVTYNTNGGDPISPAAYPQSFDHWSSSLGGTYSDEANLKDLITDDGADVILTAQWKPVSVTLPTPTKTIGGSPRTFLGWYDAPSGGNLVGNAGATVQISDNIVLYAHWDAEYSITVKVSATGFTEGQSAVFIIANTAVPGLKYTVPVTLSANSSVTVSGLPAGRYTVTPSAWSWDFVASPATSTRDVSADTVISFTMTCKGSTTVHDEKAKKNIWQD